MTEVMSVTPIILVLIILLFGSDSSVSSTLPVAPSRDAEASAKEQASREGGFEVRRFFEIF
jgi:hypothetical protein